ncbi:MAG: type II toxin-antitoxin system RelE/ParE family toxin [Synergistaceae bacterium]|jgi:phage-related protein|nr:type II toxin-antitoxin system RelE/ParE family toxin [Synergistaceae bacterium]
MYSVIFYVDEKGRSPVYDYIEELASRGDKSSRIKLNKIQYYIQVLSEYSTWAGTPYVKHLDGEIWELRPTKERILFAAPMGKSFILLHHFAKETPRTPPEEIERAKRELADFRRRERDYERTLSDLGGS